MKTGLNGIGDNSKELLRKLHRALKPDMQAFDEVRIKTVPRYKESEISGSEWRISAHVEFLRNGVVKSEFTCSDVQTACYLVGARHIAACDDGEGYYAGEGDICDQEGCARKATVTYGLKKTYCKGGHGESPRLRQYRMFCSEHSTRGDSGLDDGDSNYEVIVT